MCHFLLRFCTHFGVVFLSCIPAMHQSNQSSFFVTFRYEYNYTKHTGTQFQFIKNAHIFQKLLSPFIVKLPFCWLIFTDQTFMTVLQITTVHSHRRWQHWSKEQAHGLLPFYPLYCFQSMRLHSQTDRQRTHTCN